MYVYLAFKVISIITYVTLAVFLVFKTLLEYTFGYNLELTNYFLFYIQQLQNDLSCFLFLGKSHIGPIYGEHGGYDINKMLFLTKMP